MLCCDREPIPLFLFVSLACGFALSYWLVPTRHCVPGFAQISEFAAVMMARSWMRTATSRTGSNSQAGTNAVNLRLVLTDKAGNLKQWRFPATSLAPNGYLVVFA